MPVQRLSALRHSRRSHAPFIKLKSTVGDSLVARQHSNFESGDLIPVQPSWNQHEQKIRNQFAELGTQIGASAKHRGISEGLDRAGWQELTKVGFWKLPLPREYGGKEGSWWNFLAAFEGLALTVGDLGFLLSIIAHMGCVRVLMQYGTREQKARFVPMLTEGAIGATASTEVTGGSDVARFRTSAVQTRDGFELTGHKSHITNAPVADLFTVIGRIPALGKRDITLFIVERKLAGVRCAAPELMLGNSTSPTGDVSFDKVILGEEHVLGPLGDGLAITYSMFSLDRALYGMAAAAYTESILAQSMGFAHEREAFKRKIAEHQYVQLKITDIKIALETSRAVSYAALDRLLRDEPEANLMCSLAKFVGTEGLFQTAQNCLQLHGHVGYMQGDIARLLCDSAGTRIAGGTSDIQRVNIFNQLQKIYEYRNGN